MHRFYLPASHWNDPNPILDPRETHHALDVLRLKEGARITVFDGLGHEASARLASPAKGGAVLSLGPRNPSVPLACEITLAQAVPKGKNMDLIIQKAVELGAARIAPLLSERTVVQMEPGDAAKKSAKWREIALDACKQCGQNHLPEIDEPLRLQEFFQRLTKPELLLIASLQPDAKPLKALLAQDAESRRRKPVSVLVLIGPEGDFTPAELAMAKSEGCLPLSLGPIILRTETAAIYSLSVLTHELFE